MYRLIILTSIFISILNISKAQSSYRNLEKKISYFIRSNQDSCQFYLNKLREISETDSSLRDDVINFEGVIAYHLESDIPKAMKKYEEALDTFFPSEDDSIDFFNINRNIALVLSGDGKYLESFNLLKKCSRYYEKIKSESSLAGIYNHMAIAMLSAQKEDVAVDYFKKAVPLIKKYMNPFSLAGNYLGLAASLTAVGKVEEASLYFDTLLVMSVELEDPLLKADVFTERADILIAKKEYIKVSKELNDAINLYKQFQLFEPLGTAYFKLSKVQMNLGKFNEAVFNADSSEFYFKGWAQLNNLRELKLHQSQLYEKMGSYKKSLEFYKSYTAESDSIFSADKLQRIDELNIAYETTLKEKKILKSEKINAEQALEIQKYKNARNMLWLSLGGAIVLLILLYLYGKKQKSTRLKLAKLNQFKSNVFNVLSHDLRSPIQSIENTSNQTDVKYKANRALLMLDSLLVWNYKKSKEEQTIVKVVPEILVHDELQELSVLIEHKQLIITNHVNEGWFLQADLDAIAIILRNLIGNAIKYAPNKSTISIKSVNNTLTIENELNETYTNDGLGIGLEICKEIANENNWNLTTNKSGTSYTAKIKIA